jgi:hypothetical protein
MLDVYTRGARDNRLTVRTSIGFFEKLRFLIRLAVTI